MTRQSRQTVEDRQPVIPESSGTMVTHVLTDTDSHLIKLANQEDFDWDRAFNAVQVLDDYSVLQDPFEIPPECKARHANNEFRYRWLEPGDKDRFLMQTTGRFPWVVCNRNNAPYIPDQYRDENGLVRRAGMVLGMMRYDLYMARQMRIWKLSETTDRKGPAKAEGYEYTGTEGGKIRSGDIVVSEEVVDRSGRASFQNVNRVYGGDSDRE